MRALDAQYRTVNDSLVTLLVEAQARDLRQEIVEPRTRPGVRMRARDSNIGDAVHRVIRP
jgi:uncharacterized protein (DUF736 family)